MPEDDEARSKTEENLVDEVVMRLMVRRLATGCPVGFQTHFKFGGFLAGDKSELKSNLKFLNVSSNSVFVPVRESRTSNAVAKRNVSNRSAYQDISAHRRENGRHH